MPNKTVHQKSRAMRPPISGDLSVISFKLWKRQEHILEYLSLAMTRRL